MRDFFLAKNREKMKILAFSDIHGDKSVAERLSNTAYNENIDLVLLCGDITLFEEGYEDIIGPFIRKNKKILMVPGNHEDFSTVDMLSEMYKSHAKNIHGKAVRYENVGIFGCGGANCGPFSKLKEEEIFSVLGTAHENIKYLNKKIMVTHVHPAHTKIDELSAIPHGSTGVRLSIEKYMPDILVCGHAHLAEGMEQLIGKTKVFSVGKGGKIFQKRN